MNADQILTEIREANLSYLMLAQSLIRSDREQALYRLGISEDNAALLAAYRKHSCLDFFDYDPYAATALHPQNEIYRQN